MEGNFIMAEKFKEHDLVEVPMFNKDIRRDWIIVDFASNKQEAIIRSLFRNEQTVIEVSKLKLQKKED